MPVVRTAGCRRKRLADAALAPHRSGAGRRHPRTLGDALQVQVPGRRRQRAKQPLGKLGRTSHQRQHLAGQDRGHRHVADAHLAAGRQKHHEHDRTQITRQEHRPADQPEALGAQRELHVDLPDLVCSRRIAEAALAQPEQPQFGGCRPARSKLIEHLCATAGLSGQLVAPVVQAGGLSRQQQRRQADRGSSRSTGVIDASKMAATTMRTPVVIVIDERRYGLAELPRLGLQQL